MLPLTLILAACTTLPPPLAVEISTACESLAAEVPLPSDKITGKDLGTVADENRAVAIRANGNLRATRNCQKDQRERFAKGGK